MREYYARLFREWRRQVFIFWKAQVGVSLAAGIITAVVNAVRQQSSLQVALWSISIAVVGYLVILAVFSICAVMCAPVTLDKQRTAEVTAKDLVVFQEKSKVKELQEALAAKHPHDEHLEKQVQDEFQKLDDREREFVAWLLDIGNADNAMVQAAGFRDIALSVMSKTHLVRYTPVSPGNGLWEKDRIHHVNPKRENALRNVLHPPRPVTPPSA